MKTRRRLDREARTAERTLPRSKVEAQPDDREAMRLQRTAGNAATASLLQGKGPIQGEEPLLGSLGVQRDDTTAPAAQPAARTSQDVTVSPIAAPKDLGKGGFEWKVWFSVGAPAGADGWVIQEISYNKTATKSDKSALNDASHYWEAWKLKKAKKTTIYQDEGLDDNDDLYFTAAQPAGSKGSISVTGKVRFFEGALPADFKQNNPSTYAGVLFSSTTKPDFWSGSMAEHNLTSDWDDSVVPSKTDIKPKPK